MPGLIEQGMQPQMGGQPPGLMQQAPPPAQPTPGQPPGQMPPEQMPAEQPMAPTIKPGGRLGFDQKEFDIFLANGIKMVHTENISDRIISAVADSKNPVQAIADVTLNIVSRLEQSAEAKGKKLSFIVLAYGANVLMGEIITIAEAAGMKKLTKPEKYQAMSLATGKYLDNAVKTGKMTKEELAQLGEEAAGTEMGQKILNYDPNNPPEQIEEDEEIPKGKPPKGKAPKVPMKEEV